MDFYYVELDDYQDKDFHIISFGGLVGTGDHLNEALKHTNGIIKEISQDEYAMIVACHGNISKGIRELHDLQKKIDRFVKYEKGL